jgi:hypothetical protein
MSDGFDILENARRMGREAATSMPPEVTIATLQERLRGAALATPVRFPIKRLAVLAADALDAKEREIMRLTGTNDVQGAAP